MSLAEVKAEIRTWSEDERRKLSAFLMALEDEADPAERRKLAEKIDDKDPDHWIPLDRALEASQVEVKIEVEKPAEKELATAG
ncbi:MAG: hypothetical protein ACI8UO_000736 [Verrucomicrobiales bacterium]|jgi:hypothetical protein